MKLLDKLLGRDVEGLFSRAKMDFGKGHYEEAARNLERAKELSPDSATIWFSLGLCYSKQTQGDTNDKEKALSQLKRSAHAFERAVELAEARGGLNDDQLSTACTVVGIFYQQPEDLNRSVRYLEEAVRRNPTDNVTKVHLSRSYFFQGRANDAEDLAIEVLESDPGNRSFRAYWRELREKLGKQAHVDWPEERRRQIYAEFMEAGGIRIVSGDSLGEELMAAMTGPSLASTRAGHTLAAMERSVDSLDRAREALVGGMVRKHGLREYELFLIVEEGQANTWPFRQSVEVQWTWGPWADRPLKVYAGPEAASAFLSQESLPYLWPDDEDYREHVDEPVEGGDLRRRLRIQWTLAYLHHPNSQVIMCVFKLIHPDILDVPGIVDSLVELLVDRESEVQAEAASAIWRCSDYGVHTAFVILSSQGLASSGISSEKARRALGLLDRHCPPARRALFQREALDAFGPTAAGIEWMLKPAAITPKEKTFARGLSGKPVQFAVFTANTKLDALAFLEKEQVGRDECIVVETPEGDWGRDFDGIFKGHPLHRG